MVERIGVYPGTFDPITSGHMEVVRRSMRLVDQLVIGPAINIGKGPLFSLQERIDIIKDDIADFSEADKARIQIAPFDGLLIHFAREVDQQPLERHHLDAILIGLGEIRDVFPDDLHPLLEREQRALADVDRRADHQLVDQAQRTAHDFHVPAGDGIERARIHADAF